MVYLDIDQVHQNQRLFERVVQPFEQGTCLAFVKERVEVEIELRLFLACILSPRASEEGALLPHATPLPTIS